MPLPCATAGMSSALNPPFGSFGIGLTGATTLTDTGTLIGVVGSPRMPVLPAAGVRLIVTVACVEPTPSCERSIVAVTVAPSGGNAPPDGGIGREGWAGATLKGSPGGGAGFPLVLMPGMKKRGVVG